MTFDYSKLRGRVVEKFETLTNFANAMNLSEKSISSKINNKTYWKNNEISKACELLDIPDKEVNQYFFKQKVQETELG